MASDTEKTDWNNFLKRKKIEKMKEQLLEENFKKVELLKNKEKMFFIEKKDLKKFFPIFGLIFITIAIIGLFSINYLPWMYIKYNDSYYAEAESFFYRDDKTNLGIKEISNLMGYNCYNCSINSRYYIGLSIDDFTYTPRDISYVFIGLIILGLISIIFTYFYLLRNFSTKSAVLFYSIIAFIEIIIGVIILLLCAKFFATHFLLIFNERLIAYIGLLNVRLLVLAPIILVIFAFIIIKGAMIAVDLNLQRLKIINESVDKTRLFSKYKYGSNLE